MRHRKLLGRPLIKKDGDKFNGMEYEVKITSLILQVYSIISAPHSKWQLFQRVQQFRISSELLDKNIFDNNYINFHLGTKRFNHWAKSMEKNSTCSTTCIVLILPFLCVKCFWLFLPLTYMSADNKVNWKQCFECYKNCFSRYWDIS